MTLTYYLIFITKIRRCISNKCYDIVKFYYKLVSWFIRHWLIGDYKLLIKNAVLANQLTV